MSPVHRLPPHSPILLGIGALALAALACATLTSRAAPGQPAVFQDDFSRPSSDWDTYADDTSSLKFQNEAYVFTIHKNQVLVWGNLNRHDFEDARVEVEAQDQRLGPLDQAASFGVLCDYQDENNFYYAGLAADGYYAIIRTQDSQDTVLTDPQNGEWIQSDQIPTNAQVYRVTFECAHGTLKLSVNGRLIASVQDAAFQKGQIGLFVQTFDQPEAEVHFDNVRVLTVK